MQTVAHAAAVTLPPSVIGIKPRKAKPRLVLRPVEPLIPAIRLASVESGRLDEDGEPILLRGPTVERGSWDDPVDAGAIKATGEVRAPRQIAGFRRASPLRTLSLRPGSLITADHIKAADFLEADWEDSQRGNFPSGPPPEIRGSSGPGDYDTPQHAGRVRFEKACAAIGRMGTDCLANVVLEGQDVSSWAARKQIDRKFAVGVLFMVLDRLVEHYGPRMKQGLRPAAQTRTPSSKRRIKIAA